MIALVPMPVSPILGILGLGLSLLALGYDCANYRRRNEQCLAGAVSMSIPFVGKSFGKTLSGLEKRNGAAIVDAITKSGEFHLNGVGAAIGVGQLFGGSDNDE
ncbi:MAG TPA: hypothetical protein VK139_07090 [Microbacteriaceae bacterium]|nr:hypothetical protein [Microbacteriaceae bacterium]